MYVTCVDALQPTHRAPPLPATTRIIIGQQAVNHRPLRQNCERIGSVSAIAPLLFVTVYVCHKSDMPRRWCHISLRHFCWGAVVFGERGLDPVQVHQTVPLISIALRFLAPEYLTVQYTHTMSSENLDSDTQVDYEDEKQVTAILMLLANLTTESAS